MDDEIISSGLNFLSSAITNYQNVQLQRENRKWQQEENERVHARNLELWHMQNDYNSPQKQMERLDAAGLSPMLAYSSGNVGGLTTSNAPELSAAQSQAPKLQAYTGFNLGLNNLVNFFRDAKTFKEDIRGKELDNQNKEAQNRLLKSEAAKNEFYNWLNDETKFEQRDMKFYEKQKLINDINNTYEDTENKKITSLQKTLDAMFGAATIDSRIAYISMQNALAAADVRVKNAEYDKIVVATLNAMLDGNIKAYEHNLSKYIGGKWSDNHWKFIVQQFLYNYYRYIENDTPALNSGIMFPGIGVDH